MARLEDGSDEDEVIIDKKKKKTKEKKTYVFEIKLTDYTNDNYAEYNWKELIKKEEEKKIDPDIEIIEIDDDPVPKKKKVSKPVDPEDDYDLEDDFIDDAELNDEEVPEGVSTERGGFYINFGELKYMQTGVEEEEAPATLPQVHHTTLAPLAIIANPLQAPAKPGGSGRATPSRPRSRAGTPSQPRAGTPRAATPQGSGKAAAAQGSIKSYFGAAGRQAPRSPGGK